MDNGLLGVAAISAHDVWAVGGYDNVNDGSATLVAHWNGTRWSMISTPSTGGGLDQLNAVAAISAHDVWAVGRYYNNGFETLIEHWNGKQ